MSLERTVIFKITDFAMPANENTLSFVNEIVKNYR